MVERRAICVEKGSGERGQRRSLFSRVWTSHNVALIEMLGATPCRYWIVFSVTEALIAGNVVYSRRSRILKVP